MEPDRTAAAQPICRRTPPTLTAAMGHVRDQIVTGLWLCEVRPGCLELPAVGTGRCAQPWPFSLSPAVRNGKGRRP
jgi:hypothetical protein